MTFEKIELAFLYTLGVLSLLVAGYTLVTQGSSRNDRRDY